MSEYKLTLLYKKGLDHKTRNFIFLVILLILTIVLSVLMQRHLKNVNATLVEDRDRLSNQIDNIIEGLEAEVPMRLTLERLEEELFLTDKIMPNDNNTTITLTHLFNIFRKYSNYFYFDFRLLSSGNVTEDVDVHFHRYVLTGKAYINLLFSFIDQFERQPSFYTVESIELSSLSPEEQGKVSFNIEFNAYYTKTGTPYNRIALKNLAKRRIAYNIFYPRLYEPFVLETDVALLDLSDILMIAMTKEQVFIRNIRTGMVESLEVGSRIRHGRLQSIDWEQQQAVFRINRTGYREDYRIGTNQ